MDSTIVDTEYAPDLLVGSEKYGKNVPNNQTGMSQYGIDELNEILSYLGATNTLGRNNTMIQVIQSLIEQKQQELNYQRNLPSTQVRNLMAVGMSRSAALGTLQNGGVADSQISPFAPVDSSQSLSALSQIGSSIISGVNSFANIAQLPSSIRSKKAMTDYVNTQNSSIQDISEGNKQAAEFAQACQNAEDEGYLDKDMSLSEKISYFRKLANQEPKEDGEFNAAGYRFAVSSRFQNMLSNPYFYSSATAAFKNMNESDASVFEPTKAREIVQSMNASRKLTQDEDAYLQTELKMLRRVDMRESLVNELQLAIDQYEASNELQSLGIDAKLLENIRDDINSYTLADSLSIKAKINELSLITDPIVYNQELDNLRKQGKVIAGALLHAQFNNDVLSTAIDQVQYDQEFASDLVEAGKNQLLYRDLYGGKFYDDLTGGIRTTSSFISSIASFIGAYRGTEVLPSQSYVTTSGANKSIVESYVESNGERTVHFHRYPHRLRD